MKVTAPQMGLLQIVLEDLMQRLGAEFVPAPESSEEALEIGSRLGPELACLPLKITLGNLIQGLEKGADTIVFAGGFGPCRFGYYGQIQRIILEKAGYKFKTVIIEPPTGSISRFVANFKFLSPGKTTWQLWKIIKTSFLKGQAIDFIEKRSLQLRVFETKRGAISKARKRALKIISQAQSRGEIEDAKQAALGELEKVDVDMNRDALRIGLTGEFYLLLEPFANFDIEGYLGHKGVYLERGVYLSDWISPSSKNKVSGVRHKEIVETASPYLAHSVGGEGQPTIGHTIHFARHDFDGVIHIFPFTCMPEIIADSILPKVQRDFDIPILTLVIDEQSGRAGLITRLEAFIDLLKSRRDKVESGELKAESKEDLCGVT